MTKEETPVDEDLLRTSLQVIRRYINEATQKEKLSKLNTILDLLLKHSESRKILYCC